MGHLGVRDLRCSVAWALATALVVTTVTLVTVIGAAASPAHAAGVCGDQRACIRLLEGLAAPGLWEEGPTRLALVVDPAPDKDVQVQLTIGPADGKDGRAERFHRLDVAAGESGLVAGRWFNLTVPAGESVMSFTPETTKGDTIVEPDEWFDVAITGEGIADHTSIPVIDDEAATLVDLRLDEGATVPESDSIGVEVIYLGDADRADVTLLAVQDPVTSRVIEVEPQVVRVDRGDPVKLTVKVVGDSVTQGTSKVSVIAYAYAADLGLPEPEPVERFAAGRPRPIHGTSPSFSSVDVLPPRLSISSTRSAAESAGNVTLTVTRSGDLSAPLLIPLVYTDQTATQGLDYPSPEDPGAVNGVSLASGQSSASFDVNILPDAMYEGNETFLVALEPQAGMQYGTRVATVTITDVDDVPFAKLVPGDPVHAGHTGEQVPFHLTVPIAPAVPVAYQVVTSDVEAFAPSDYVAFDQMITIGAGSNNSNTFHITVNPVADPGLGQSPRFQVNVFSDLLETLTHANFVHIDNPLEPAARISRFNGAPPDAPLEVELHEGTAGPITHQLVVTKSEFVDTAEPYQVDVAVVALSEDPAVLDRIDTDVSVSPETFTLTPQQNSQTVSVTIAGNDIEQDDLEFMVALTNPWRFEFVTSNPDDTAYYTILDDDAPSGDNAADTVRNGIGDWFDGLLDWLEGLRLPDINWPEDPDDPNDPDDPVSPPFDLPALPDLAEVFELDDLFDTDDVTDNLEEWAFDDNADDLDEAVADFVAKGCAIDHVAGGLGGHPAPDDSGDILQVRCTVTPADIDTVTWIEGLDGLPDGFDELFTAAGLELTTEWSAELVEFTVVAGVDASGLYLLGESGVRMLGLSGSGQVAGPGGALGVQNLTLDGTAEADLDVTVTLHRDADLRLRSAELATIVPGGLAARVNGSTDVTVAATLDDTALDWHGTWAVVPNSDPLAVTTTQALTLTQELPGFALGDAGAPAVLTLHGDYGTCDGAPGWELAGSFAPAAGESFTFDGFAVSAVTATGCADATGLTLTVAAGIVFGEGVDAITVDLELHLDHGAWAITGSADVEELDVGPVTITDGTLTFTAEGSGDTFGVSVTFSAATATFFDSTLTGVQGTLHGTEQLTLHADSMDAAVAGGALLFALTDVDVAVPGVDGVVFSVDSATATAPEIGDGLTVTVADLEIHDDGRFAASSVSVVQPAGIARSIGLGGLVPVDLTGLELVFTNRDPATGAVHDLSEFTVSLSGTVDLSAFAGMPFEPVVQLGGDVITPTTPEEQRAISMSADVRVTDTGALVVTPRDLGPITLGLNNLQVGALTFSAQIQADGYQDGVLLPGFGGFARVEGGFDGIEGSLTADLTGQFVDGAHGPEVHATAEVGFSAASDGGAELSDLAATLDLVFGFDADGAPFLDADLTGVTLGSATLPLGDFATMTTGDLTLDLTPEPGAPMFTIGGSLAEPGTGVGITFDEAIDVLDGWGARAGGLAIHPDWSLRLAEGFFADLTIPDGEQFGLPDFLPLYVDQVGFDLGDAAPGDPLEDVLGNLQLSVSGGLRGTEAFPISASFDRLTVDFAKLRTYDPVACGFDPACLPANLGGFSMGIEPALELGAASISGGLTLGTAEVGGEDVLYGRIFGHLRTPAFEAGGEVVVSEYGPVLLRVTAPAAVPIAQTGFVLSGVTGAASFGDATLPVPDLGQPTQLIAAIDNLPTELVIDDDAIAAAVAGSVAAGTPTWEQGFAIALKGTLTHAAVAGMVTGNVTVATAIGLAGECSGGTATGPQIQLIGAGDIDAMGIPLAGGGVARAAFLIDIDVCQPWEPSFDLAVQVPMPGSPLAALIPVSASGGVQIRTDGVVEGLVAGASVFVDEMAAGTLDAVAARLAADPAHPLTRLVLAAGDDVTDLDGAYLGDRLLTLLTGERAAEVVSLLMAAVADYVTTLDQASAEQLMADMLATFRTAAESALATAESTFNPSLTITAEMQPTLLGVPMGEPDQSLTLMVTKDSLGFTFEGSMIEQVKSGLGGAVAGPLGEALVAAALLGARDSVTVGVQLPLPSMSSVLFGGAALPADALDPEQPGWSVTLGGSFEQLGMRAEVTGFLTGAGNQVFVDSMIERRWECSDGTTPVPPTCLAPPDPDRIQFTREVDYDNLLAHGGLVLDGRLEMPRLITDPADVLGEVPPIPEDDPFGVLAWFATAGEVVTQTETPLRATFFVPLPGAVVAGEQTLEEWAAAISMTGVFEGTRQTPESDPVARLLSIPIGEGRMVATTQGVEITADIPLLGVEGTFAARVDEVPFEGGTVTVPVGKLEAAMSSAELDAALTTLGLPSVFDVSGVSGTAGFRAYTPGFDPDSPDRLQRVGGMAFTANLDAAGFVDDARAEVVVTGTDFTATAAVDQLGPFGPLTVTDAELTIRKLGAAVTTHVAGSASLLGSDWSVAATLDSSLNGTFHLTGGGDLGGFAFDGSVDVTRTGGNVAASVSGELSIPGVGELAASGSFDSAGNLNVTVGTPTGFRIGGASSPFFAVGQFRLATLSGAVTFRATNAGFQYRQSNGTVLFSAVVPTFAISSNGAFSVSTNAFTLGPSTGVHLEVPATTLSANANGLALRVRIPANAKLVIPDLADGTSGKPKINIPTALDINTSTFEYTLVNATGTQAIDLGLMRLSGKLVFKRVNGGPFRLEIQGPTSTTPARVNLGELGNVDFPNFLFATNGDFDVLATTNGLGPTNPRFRISEASVRLRNTGNATATASDDFVELRIAGGDLELPSVAPIALPDLSLRVGETFTQNITVPAIDLGPAFRTNQSSTFTLTIERARVRLELRTTANVTSTCGGASLSVRNGPTITALAGSSSMRLNSFLVDSNGAFTGSVTGCLQVFGNELAHGTFNVRLRNGVFELSLPSPGLNVNWGFGTVRVTGFARSDGTFSFSGTMSTNGSLPGVSWNGSATITATHQRLSGSFSGQVSLLGLSGSATGSVDSTGRVTGTLRVDLDGDGDTNGVPGFCVPVVGCTPSVPERAAFDFRIGGSLSPDNTAPTMATPSNITVTTSETGSTIPVYFAHPVATDNRDGAITATCSPGSGSQFTIGATRTVSCTARDSAGNSVSRSFTVTVSRASANVTVSTSTVIATVGGFAVGSVTLAAVHSDPTAVATATADADGVARYEFAIPEDLPAGEHHIVAVGTAPDGSDRQWVVPIVLATGGEVVSVETNTGELPTGVTRFVPVTPVRLFDTRPSETAPGPKGRVGPEGSIDVQVTGTAAGVPAEAVAVVMNVTVTDTGGPGYVTAYPAGGARPLASSINIAQAGQTRPNLVTVPIGDGGRVTLFSKGAAHLLADVAGYYLPADGPVAEGRFVPLTPQRLFDTRDGQNPLAAGESIDIGVLGQGLVPATGVAAVVLNLTATEAASAGYVTAYPAGQERPLASTVNLSSAGDTAPNLAIVPIGADGAITIFASHGAHVLGDVAGYITDNSAAVDDAGLFVPLAPERVFDTRESEAAPGPKGFVPAGGQIDVAVAGVGNVPADAAGVVLNVTGVGSPGGFLTAWPTGPERPLASTLNFAAPVDTRANAAILPIGEGGHVSFYAKLGAHVLADAAGYFLG